ncbi:formyltransferase family protein, partial [Alphaproteobacteria bacterium]|nr:formyltransferase family protein [Alphaproteobacteria bacterium]
IINGEKHSGTTAHFVNNQIDEGDIIKIKKCKITNSDTGYSLYNKVEIISLDLFIQLINNIKENKKIKLKKIKQNKGKYYSRKLPYEGIINWNWKSKNIHNFIRALNSPDHQGAKTIFLKYSLEINKIKILKEKSTMKPGFFTKLKNNCYKVSTSDYNTVIQSKELQKIINDNQSIKIYNFSQ